MYAPVPIYLTDRCNSKCLICNIWRKRPKTDIDVGIVKKILSDKSVSRFTMFVIGGGEPLLHPKFDEIMTLFRGRDYLFLSNGLLADKLIETVREFEIKRLSLSLDGSPETYRKIRGVDGYSNIEKIVAELKDDDVTIYANYVINPWNTRQDLIHVIDFCRKNGIYFLAGYYENFEYLETTKKTGRLYNINDLLRYAPLESSPNHPYFKLHPHWVSGHLRIPCFSVFLSPVIKPNGDVELCEVKEVKLGNLYEQDLGEIWASKKTRDLQRRFMHCNACWADGHRPVSIHVGSLLRSFVPAFFLNRIFGKYDWEKLPHLVSRALAK